MIMDIETKVDLAMRPPTEEMLTAEELRTMFQAKEHPGHYIGLEPSGYLHIGTLIVSGYKVNDLEKAGVKTQIYLADYHAFINNKLGGNWDNIQKAAKYFDEGFKFFCPKTRTVSGTQLYHDNDEYWMNIIRFSKHITLARDARCMTIMGRSESDKLDFGQYLYPPMQAVDIKELGADIAHGGMDQRKVHVLAREVYPKMGWEKPVALHHHLMMGLSEPAKAASEDKLDQVVASKMSKSKPWTAIFVHDTEDEIRAKIAKAWCPEKTAEMNPVMELVKYVIFHDNKDFEISRPAKFGGNQSYGSYEAIEADYVSGKIHPADLKASVSAGLNTIVKPVRDHFEKPSNQKLMEVFKEAQITR
jgi:tyrosyl-tRNA synthetase